MTKRQKEDRDVALLAEGVGRNLLDAKTVQRQYVALLAEGVGRNTPEDDGLKQPWVALLAEGVGRNVVCEYLPQKRVPSPSSRRAWVEIH